MQLYTIGYENAPQAAVIGTLKQAGVRTLIDVRELPLSRRAGFSKTPLSASLAEAGIAYVHLKYLGTPKQGRQANWAGRLEEFWAVVEDALSRPEAQHALAHAAALAQDQGPACLLCLEADHTRCHRLRVAGLLADRGGFAVAHLSAAGPAF